MPQSAPTQSRPPPTNGAAKPKGLTFSRFKPGITSVRMVLNAVEGFGKTTFGAQAPDPVILMARGETGFKTLREAGLVPDVPAAVIDDWLELLDALPAVTQRTVVLDALGGFERLCYEFVCRRDFGGDWGEKGFASFGKGAEVSQPEWLKLLTVLDSLRDVRGSNIVILSHAKVRPFKNPMGADFDRYVADCHEKTWGLTHKWADVVLFGQFVTVTQEDRRTKRMRGIGGTERIAYAQRTDAFDAKNRFNIPAELHIGERDAMWADVWNAVNGKTENANEEIPS